jgi:UDP-GlcNAc:undecaprenyl-phosphate GlcNAc-1-phosphate transferase
MNSRRERIDYWLGFGCLALLLVILPPGWISAWSWKAGERWLYVAAVAFFCVGALMPLTLAAADRLGAIDRPDPRKVHSAPTPRLGGLAVFGAVLFTLWRAEVLKTGLLPIVEAGAILFLVEVVDDVRGLPASTRLLGQALASVLVVWPGMQAISALNPLGTFWASAATVLWLVGLTNAFNFLDGIDGLAGGLGIVCSLFFLAIAWTTRQMELAFAAAALMGACAGFLRFNWHPARVFLGDSGSTFIGFLLASLAVYGGWATGNLTVAVSTPVLILGIPIFDLIYITLSRIRRGDVRTFRQWLEYAGKDHLHHRLLHLGLRPPQAVFFILTVNLILGLGAIAMHHTSSTLGAWLLLAQSVLIFLVVVFLMLLGRDLKGPGAPPKHDTPAPSAETPGPRPG